MPWAVLVASCIGMFAASCSGTTRAPFLIEIARDLHTAVPLVANVMALSSIAWGTASLCAGAGSDRWGRGWFLLGGPVGLAGAMFGVAQSDSFTEMALWATLGGASSGSFVGVLFAEVSARVQDGQRGRALGWVMAGQSLTLLVGVPLAAWVGSYVGWRGVSVGISGLALLALLGLVLSTRGGPDSARPKGSAGVSWREALQPRVIHLLVMGVTERICYGLIAVYFATFLQTRYALSVRDVAVPLVVFAAGNICGTVLGGQLADRLAPWRMVTFAGAMLASGLAALVLFSWTPDVTTSVALGFTYVFLNSIARPSLLASLAMVPAEVRGTVLGMNVTSASFGWLGAASLGGWMMATQGFVGFGPLAAGMTVLGAAMALRHRS